MLLNRDELIETLFRETDRAQRMKTPLAVICCRINDWPMWQSRLEDAALGLAADEFEKRITLLLRSYDSIGRVADGELVLVLPGCNRRNAEIMATRFANQVFTSPVKIGQQQVQFNASFGVVSSGGRSPLVVLSEAERTLQTYSSEGGKQILRLPAEQQAAHGK
jgi:two-component system, cell cycle response regulator